MTEWPFEADDWAPSPELVAVWAKLGMIPPERVPLWAAHWLVAGHDGEHVVHLAGLHGDDSREVNDALPDALLDCGVTLPESEAAAATVVYTDLARMHLDGQAGALWVCQQVDRLLSGFEFDDDLMRLPLSRLYDVDCEWDGGWGRTVQQLTAFVRETCEEQVLLSGQVLRDRGLVETKQGWGTFVRKPADA